jgi:hypothetical protein
VLYSKKQLKVPRYYVTKKDDCPSPLDAGKSDNGKHDDCSSVSEELSSQTWDKKLLLSFFFFLLFLFIYWCIFCDHTEKMGIPCLGAEQPADLDYLSELAEKYLQHH